MATVRIGSFFNTRGDLLQEPIPERTVFLWVHWDQDPGNAFTTSSLTTDLPNRGIQIIGRKDNSFLFLINGRGREGITNFSIAANIFGSNKEVSKNFRWQNYDGRIRSWVVPSTTVTSKTVSVTAQILRGRPHYGIVKECFTLTGVVDGLPYESKADITSAGPEVRSGSLGRVITITANLPVNSKGFLRIRLDAHSIYTENSQAGKAYAPVSDAYSPPFAFDTTARSSPTIERGVEGTVAATHTDGSTITAIDYVLDIRDERWFLPPINDIEWQVDQNSFYNQIRINFEDGGKPYYEEDTDSLALYGGQLFEITVPLQRNQTEWVKWIARTFLQTNARPKYHATLNLVNSLYLELGDILYLRQKENPGIVVQVTSLDHDYSTLETQARVLRINRNL